MVYKIVLGRTENDKKKFGDKAAIFLGRHYVKMGQVTSLSSNLLLDVAKAHVILVSGKRGSGKSYTVKVFVKATENFKPGIYSVSSTVESDFGEKHNIPLKLYLSPDDEGIYGILYRSTLYLFLDKFVFIPADGYFSKTRRDLKHRLVQRTTRKI